MKSLVSRSHTDNSSLGLCSWFLNLKQLSKFMIRLCLFRCKIFSIAKCFQMKMIPDKMIFFFFCCILEDAPENILQCCANDRAEGAR